MPIFPSARRDRQHLVSTLTALGPTSVSGLAAALSWTPRKTERTIRSVQRHGEAVLQFDGNRGTVAFFVPKAKAAPPPAPVVEGSVPPDAARDAPPSFPTIRPSARPATLAAPKCPGCGVRLSATSSPDVFVCPSCGELSRHRVAAPLSHPLQRLPGPAPMSPGPAPIQVGHGPTPLSEDRRAQELFAAWVTSQSINCPKCKTALRHRGIGEYVCPGCGQTVSFARSASSVAPSNPTTTAAPVAPPPAS